MPEEATNTGCRPVRLLPVTVTVTVPVPAAPVLAAPALGEWHRRGLCADEDPDLFFPSHGSPGTKAREICAACAVREQCLDYALDADQLGIWGGLDQQERRNLKRKRQRRRKAASTQADQGPRSAETA